MSRTVESDLRKLISRYAKTALIWIPLLVGIIHQIAMRFFDFERIYVFVDPPGYIGPEVSLEYQWWIVLVLGTSMVYSLIVFRRLATFPKRTAAPFYLYLLFLLIFVKPL